LNIEKASLYENKRPAADRLEGMPDTLDNQQGSSTIRQAARIGTYYTTKPHDAIVTRRRASE